MTDPTTDAQLAHIARCTCGSWTWLTTYELVTGEPICDHLTPDRVDPDLWEEAS